MPFVCLRGAKNIIHREFSWKETASVCVIKRYSPFLKHCREIIYVFWNAAVMSATSLVCVYWVQQMVVLWLLNAAFGGHWWLL